MSTRESKVGKLKNREYRDAYVGEYLHANIAYQIRALRKQRDWDQSKLADNAGMMQPRISAIENPSNSRLNLDTLLRLANAFDVALVVRFAAFSDLLHWSESFSPDTFEVNSFADDCYLRHPINKGTHAGMAASLGAAVQPLNQSSISIPVTGNTINSRTLVNFGVSNFVRPATFTAIPLENKHGHKKEKVENPVE